MKHEPEEAEPSFRGTLAFVWGLGGFIVIVWLLMYALLRARW